MLIRKRTQLTGHNAAVFALQAEKDNRHILSAGGEGWVARWDLNHPENGKLIAKTDSRIFSILLLQPDHKLIIGNMDGGIHWIDLDNPDNTKNLSHHKKGVFDLQTYRNSLFSAGGDGKISRWIIPEARAAESLYLSGQSLRCMAVSDQREEIALGSSDQNIYLLDANTLEIKEVLSQAHQNSVFSIAYSPGGNYLLSGGRDAMLRRWDLHDNCNMTVSLPAHMFTINSLAFQPGGELLATASRDKTVKIWDAASLSLLKVLEGSRDGGHFNSVNKVCWSGDGHTLISAGDDRSLILWQVLPS